MVLDGDELTGRLFIHLGDDSEIVLKREPEKKSRTNKKSTRPKRK